MNKPQRYDNDGVPVFTAESAFREGESVYIHMSTEFPEFVGVRHKHEFIEIVYVISGSAEHEKAAGRYPVSKGDVVIVNYDTPHAFHEMAGKERFEAYDLMFTPDFLDASLIRAGDFNEMCSSFLFYSLFPAQESIGPDVHLSDSSYGVFGELFHKIYMEYKGRQKGYCELMRAYVIELIIKLFRKLESRAGGKISQTQKRAVEQTVAYLRESFHTHITLDELATRIFLNKDYLNRIFRKSTGMPVNAFLQRIRVEEACRLLAAEDPPWRRSPRRVALGIPRGFMRRLSASRASLPANTEPRTANDKIALLEKSSHFCELFSIYKRDGNVIK